MSISAGGHPVACMVVWLIGYCLNECLAESWILWLADWLAAQARWRRKHALIYNRTGEGP